jgi:hypothetical protein
MQDHKRAKSMVHPALFTRRLSEVRFRPNTRGLAFFRVAFFTAAKGWFILGIPRSDRKACTQVQAFISTFRSRFEA